MNITKIKKILNDTAFVRTGGTEKELEAAEYLKALCEAAGAVTGLESFPVQMANIKKAELYADGKSIPCKGFFNCGCADLEAELVYLPSTDVYSLTTIRGKVVLLDTGIGVFTYEDLLKYGAVGVITYDGNVNFPDNDIDQKELRAYVHKGTKIPCVNINAKSARSLVKNGTKKVRIVIDQDEYEGESRNVVADIPGKTDEFIVFTAHYDSTSLSKGSYDNMTGSIGILGILEELAKTAPHRYGLRFVFCGSEERGLLGAKAYCEAHAEELAKCVLNINLDMIGSIMGKFIAVCTSESRLVSYIEYFSAQNGWGITARPGVYSSDSTPFADKGVPAVSFARIAGSSQASIHNRYDTVDVLSAQQIKKDIEFLCAFSANMADAAVCPVKRDIPDSLKRDLDDYLGRKRKD